MTVTSWFNRSVVAEHYFPNRDDVLVLRRESDPLSDITYASVILLSSSSNRCFAYNVEWSEACRVYDDVASKIMIGMQKIEL